MVGEPVLPEVMRGITEASATRKPSSPWTLSLSSTTANGILRRSHFRRPDRMEDRRADLARRSNQFIVRLQVCPGLELSRRVARKRGRAGEAPRKTDRVHRDSLIGKRRQIVRLDDGRARGSALMAWVEPRLSGRRLQTLIVIAG